MSCYFPRIVYRSKAGRDPETGNWPVVFDFQNAEPGTTMVIACGQCTGCRLDKSKEWAIRCLHESKEHKENSFITLTYDNKSLIDSCGMFDEEYGCITDFTLNKRDFVLFMKKLRNKETGQIRFFHCGEYGDLKNRPHHHALLFGKDFQDKKYEFTKKGNKLYRSEKLERIWEKGRCLIGEVNFRSAAYVARYQMKKINGVMAEEHYNGRQPEYVTMSRNPGLGAVHYAKYGNDYYRKDEVIVNGLKLKPPRYYDKLFDSLGSDELEEIKNERRKVVQKKAMSFKRLNAARKCKEAIVKNFTRECEEIYD